ncbi:MAG: DegT/DnrJ/EryC1/StrS family aminotransferase [Acidobacteria bacterium]|nr:DegT/DnrJ/EryC1/StrS family aminotransferase [Acidobacteriota bacterium]
MKRRSFLTAAAVAAAPGAEAAPKLAVDGGTPVRDKPLRAGYWGSEFYDDKERAEVLEVLEAKSPFRWYGPKTPRKVLQFETEFAARMQTRFAVGVTSGTAALDCAMAALQIGPGDEVILPAWTWHSCFNAVVLAGGLPVCAEIDESFNLDPDDIENRITPQTKVIMAVHLQGNPCDMDSIMAIARRHKLRVLEDCAQSVGASYKGRPLGSIGDIGIYSLQLNKTITAGEGGAVVTNDPELFERASRFHDLGGFRPPHQSQLGQARLDWFFGTNFRMSEFTGGVLLAQLRKLDKIVAAVRANAGFVHDGIRDLPGLRLRHRPDPAGELGTGVFFDFSTKARCDRFLAAMKAENVAASRPGGSVILPTLPHVVARQTLHPAWPAFQTPRGKAIRYGAESCPRTIDILSRFSGVLMDPKFSKRDLEDVVAAIRKVHPAVSS